MNIMFVEEYYRSPAELKIESHSHFKHYGTALENTDPKFDITFVFTDAGIIRDPAGNLYRYAGDADFLRAVLEFKPEIIFYSPKDKKIDEPNPDRVIFAYIAWKLGIRIVGLARDVGIASVHMWDKYYPMMHKILQIDGFNAIAHTSNPGRWIKMFEAHISGYDYPPTAGRPILISHTGRPNGERKDFLRDIKAKGIDIWHRDFGDYENNNMPNMPYRELCEIQANSMMTLSDSIDRKFKGRGWEGAMCGCLVLECEDCDFSNWFVPDEEYVPYGSTDDLCEKIVYYRDNETERLRIANAGYNKWKTTYTGSHFWRETLRRINE